MEWVVVIARTLIATPGLKQGSKNITHHEFEATLNAYSKISSFCVSN